MEQSVSWVENKLYGVEKDYRLARVSKTSLFMHGAGDGNIIFGDGLENYKEKNVVPNTFDILVANPPYSVAAFKPHLRLKDNEFEIISKISNNGSEIETLFVERIAQLVKPEGIAAVVLPSSILNKENESFIAARESILKNFYIRAIAQLGSKTFGATGTNTVILFLEKYKENPKRADMVEDSVKAIFDNCTLAGWEDEIIFDGYLEKIGVEEKLYKKFLNREVDYTEWEKEPYFAQYVSAFKTSSECVNKEKQKNFEKASDAEKLVWYNQHFYDYTSGIETEKMTYFAFCYCQNTLIVSAPEDIKEQEKFLGYKWSNRKGQEGIQIITPGGMLYNEADRTDANKIAGIIRNAFLEKQCHMKELEAYYYYLRLQDMLDFSGVNFNKAIKTTRTRQIVPKAGMTSHKLSSSDFEVSIGNRVLSTEIEEDGEYPIYSANVFEVFGRINKQNLTDFSRPSIIWGIDGDWMVNYIPENQPFYPTDHCGVIRVNTDEIEPQYMALALQVEGEYEKFSRSNRASTQRIKNLVINVPKKEIQKKIVVEIAELDEKIREEDVLISKYDEDVKVQFAKMSKQWELTNNTENLGEYLEYITYGFTNPMPDAEQGPWKVTAKDVVNGRINFDTARKTTQEAYDRLTPKSKPMIGDVLLTKDGTLGRTATVGDENICVNQSVAVLRPNARILPKFLAVLLQAPMYQKEMIENSSGGTIKHIYITRVDKMLVIVPNLEKQKAFVDFAASLDKLKLEATNRKKEYQTQRELLIDKYFK